MKQFVIDVSVKFNEENGYQKLTDIKNDAKSSEGIFHCDIKHNDITCDAVSFQIRFATYLNGIRTGGDRSSCISLSKALFPKGDFYITWIQRVEVD
jgi:hypothetical protein